MPPPSGRGFLSQTVAGLKRNHAQQEPHPCFYLPETAARNQIALLFFVPILYNRPGWS